MRLSDVEYGRLFSGSKLGLGIKVREDRHAEADTGYCSCILNVKYELLAPELVLNPLCPIEDFDTGSGIWERNPIELSRADVGRVFEAIVGNGTIPLYCSTDFYIFTGRVCFALTFPTGVPSHMDVIDHGYAGLYDGMIEPVWQDGGE